MNIQYYFDCMNHYYSDITLYIKSTQVVFVNIATIYGSLWPGMTVQNIVYVLHVLTLHNTCVGTL